MSSQDQLAQSFALPRDGTPNPQRQAAKRYVGNSAWLFPELHLPCPRSKHCERNDILMEAAMATLTKAALQDWRNSAIALDLYEGGYWNPENTISWLRQQDPAVWHELVRGFNWCNSGIEPLRAVVAFPICDRATVMSIFALVGPDYYEDTLAGGTEVAAMSECDREVIALLDAIKVGFEAGKYTKGLYRCVEEPKHWGEYYSNRRGEGKPVRWHLPPRAFEATQELDHEPAFVLHNDRFLIPYER